ncbi:WbqC family protein [Viscerimonas tarda]
MSIYLSTAYLAPVQYYSKLLSKEGVFIERCDNYVKQTYRNRCTILSANGALTLSIPVEHNKAEKCLTRDVRIANSGNWQHLHWNAILSAYNSTPFFEYYRDDFRPFYEKKQRFLFDFNEELRILICDLIGIDTQNIRYTEAYQPEVLPGDKDFRETIHPKKTPADPDFHLQPYYQVFGERFGFTENLSILDLLFNMGNESLLLM